MTREKKTGRDKTAKRKGKKTVRDRELDRSFQVLEQRLNQLSRMLLLPPISRAACRKLARSAMESRYFNSGKEKKLSRLREEHRAGGDAMDRAVAALSGAWGKRDEKMRKEAEAVPLLDSIQENLRILQEELRGAVSRRDSELRVRLEALDAEDTAPPDGGLGEVPSVSSDDAAAESGAARLKAGEKSLESVSRAIEAAKKIIEAVTELEGSFGMGNLALCYYRRYPTPALTVGGALFLAFFLLFAAVVYKETSPLFVRPVEKTSEPRKEAGDGGSKERGGEAPGRPAPAGKRALSPDELFRESLVNRKPFIPNCRNNYVLLAGEDLSDPGVERRARSFLASRNLPVEGDKAVHIIKARDEGELEAALRNGALNSPYCVKGKFFPPEKLGFDLGRFPVYLPKGMDPRGLDAKIRIDEQLNFARTRLRRKNIYLLPEVYFSAADGAGAKAQKTQGYQKAVRDYISHYRKALEEAGGIKKGH